MKGQRQRREEFERILERFSNSIHAQVERSGLRMRGIDPEDIIQEVRVRLWKRIGSEKKILHPQSYIKRVVSSVVIEEIDKARRREELIVRTGQEEMGAKASPAKKAMVSEIPLRVIEEALSALIESRRRATRLFLVGLTIEEISAALRWSPNKTRNLVYRGLADLKTELSRKGVDYED